MWELLQMALENKDVFATMILLIVIFFYIRPANTKALTQQQLHNSNIILEMNKWFKLMAQSLNKTRLSDAEILEIARHKVWYASEAKLLFIRWKLEKNNLTERRATIEKHIKDELTFQSSKYIKYLDNYQVEINWELTLVWKYIENNFDMDTFLLELFDVIFRDVDPANIDIKLNDCRFVMKSYQNSLFEKMRKELWKI